MNKPVKTIVPNLVQRVRAMSAASQSGERVIRELDGMHPIEIKATLLSAGEDNLAKSVFDSIAVDLPCIHEIVREDNPILNFWSFTTQSAAQLAKMVHGFSSVALLGAPTLYTVLRDQSGCDVHLFERDDYLLREEAAPGFHRCDVVAGIPRSFNDSFDLVIGDPPWYFDEYSAWLATAERIVRPGGSVMFVLFPAGIRDAAPTERNAIVGLAETLFNNVSLSDLAVEYDTPSFEQVQMIRSGIQPINWRRAALLVGQGKKGNAQAINRIVPQEHWVERRVGSGRLFVNLTPIPDDGEFLREAQTGSRFLLSPSRRDPARKRANIISSRGHGLQCANPAHLLQLVRRLDTADDVDKETCSLTDDSKRLFKELVLDLWPRFIRC